MKILFPLLYLSLTCAACKAIKPEAPVTTVQQAPVSVCPPSRIVLPVSIRLDEYYKMADAQLDKQFDGAEVPCSGVSFNYHFERNPLSFKGEGSEMVTNVDGKYWIRMSYCPECTGLFTEKPLCIVPRIPFSCGIGEPMRRMSIQFRSSFTLTPDYGIRTVTRLSGLQAKDPCEVTVFSYDATDQLLKEVKKALGTLSKDIDKETAKISLKPEAADLWKTLSQPIAVPGFGFVHMQPASISLSKPLITGNILNCALELQAKPEFTTYRKTLSPASLPPLNLVEKQLTDTLSLYSDLRLNYDSLSVVINRFAHGQSFELKGKKVIIDSISIKGPQQDKLVFKLQFSGDKRGTLYVNARPSFNPETQTIELKETDFDLETKSVLLRTARWLFNDRILTEIEKASRQDLNMHFQKMLISLNKSLKFEKNGFLISGSIHQIRVEGLFPETDDLVVRISAKGKMSLQSAAP